MTSPFNAYKPSRRSSMASRRAASCEGTPALTVLSAVARVWGCALRNNLARMHLSKHQREGGLGSKLHSEAKSGSTPRRQGLTVDEPSHQHRPRQTA